MATRRFVHGLSRPRAHHHYGPLNAPLGYGLRQFEPIHFRHDVGRQYQIMMVVEPRHSNGTTLDQGR